MAKTEENDGYGTSEHAYLERAKQMLNDGRKPQLFYAALELRCCIESRQDTYVQAQKQYARSIPRSWQIGPKARTLEQFFNSRRLAKLTFSHSDLDQPVIVYYSPVTADLNKSAKQLGDYLHAKALFHAADDPWWSDFRDRLINIYRMAWVACRGELICPPLISRKDPTRALQTNLTMEARPHLQHFIDTMREGRTFSVAVEYPSFPRKNGFVTCERAASATRLSWLDRWLEWCLLPVSSRTGLSCCRPRQAATEPGRGLPTTLMRGSRGRWRHAGRTQSLLPGQAVPPRRYGVHRFRPWQRTIDTRQAASPPAPE